METNNSAARLYDILSTARSQFDPKQREVKIIQVWASVLNVGTEDTVERLHFVAHLLALLRQAKLDVQALPGVNTQIYLKPFSKLERAFSSMNLDASWNNFTSHLDDATMVALEFCADTLSNNRPEPIIDAETLKSLQADVESLIEKITLSDLLPETKLLFLKNLENIRLAILEYRINGSVGLSQSLDLSLGSILRNKDKIDQVGDQEIFPAFFRIMFKINQLVTYANNAKQLLEPIVKHFLPHALH